MFASHCSVSHAAGPRVLLQLQTVLQRSPGETDRNCYCRGTQCVCSGRATYIMYSYCMSVYIMKSAFRSCKPCSHLNHDLGFKERPSQLSSNISCTSKDILLKFLLAGDLVKTSELLPSFDLIELGLAHRLAVLGVQAIHFLLQQVSVAVCILALLSLAVSALLPQQPPLLPHLLHPALVVVRAFLLGARSALWLLFVFSRLDTDVAKVLKPY